MAGISKVTFFFSDGKYGWTETYYDTTNPTTPSATWNKAVPLAQARAACLAGGGNPCATQQCGVPILSLIRVSTVGQPRTTLFGNSQGMLLVNNTGRLPGSVLGLSGAGTPASNLGASDNPYSAMELVCFLNTGTQSKRSISGVPDGVICDQAFNNGDPWVAAFKTFATLLGNGSWGALSQYPVASKSSPTPGQAIAQLGCVGLPLGSPGIIQDPSGRPYITLGTPISFNVPGASVPCISTHLVVFGYVPDRPAPNINGVYRAFPLGLTPTNQSTACFLLNKRFTPLHYLCLGYAVPVQPSVTPFSDILLNRPTKRDRGRPTGLPVGRAKVHH